MRGPIDYISVGFPGNNFKGEIFEALGEAVENKSIAVLDVAVITKDKDGAVSSLEMAAKDDALIKRLEGGHAGDEGIISAEDVAEVGELLENDTSAGLLIVEHLWAKPLKRAIMNADGVLLAEGRIHPDAMEEIDETNQRGEE